MLNFRLEMEDLPIGWEWQIYLVINCAIRTGIIIKIVKELREEQTLRKYLCKKKQHSNGKFFYQVQFLLTMYVRNDINDEDSLVQVLYMLISLREERADVGLSYFILNKHVFSAFIYNFLIKCHQFRLAIL